MSEEPKQIRFIVNSAQEAVERVRESLGPRARVVSVRQVTGKGLKRFVAAPQLEIVAEEEQAVPPEPEQAAPEPRVEPELVAAGGGSADPEESAKAEGARPRCKNYLTRAGFSPALMSRLEASDEWRTIGEMPVDEGIPRAVAWLRRYRDRAPEVKRPLRLAFLGGPGSGKTTALCKYLAKEVFLKGTRPEVLRLEVDKPHRDDALAFYCEILGVSFHNDPDEVNADGNRPLLIDFPGFQAGDHGEIHGMAQTLRDFGIHDRVLVLNACYESTVLKRYLSCAGDLGAQYQVLTHVDELTDFGKLWFHAFDLERRILFLSNGENIAGDLIEDAFGFLLEKTFPK